MINKVARGATEVLAPWVWVILLPFAVAAAPEGTSTCFSSTCPQASSLFELGAEGIWKTLLWGFVVAVTASVIPMAVIVRGARKGKWDGHHVTNREGRLVPLVTAGASLAAGTVIMVLGGAPANMLALAGSMFASLIVSMAITFGLKWKISLHAAVAWAAVVTLTIVFGPWWLLLALPAALVAWSRVELRDHTAAQVLAGSAMGVLVGGGSFWLLSSSL